MREKGKIDCHDNGWYSGTCLEYPYRILAEQSANITDNADFHKSALSAPYCNQRFWYRFGFVRRFCGHREHGRYQVLPVGSTTASLRPDYGMPDPAKYNLTGEIGKGCVNYSKFLPNTRWHRLPLFEQDGTRNPTSMVQSWVCKRLAVSSKHRCSESLRFVIIFRSR